MNFWFNKESAQILQKETTQEAIRKPIHLVRIDQARQERLAARATKEAVHVLKFSNRYEP